MPSRPPPTPYGFQSRSTPNFPTIRNLEASSGSNTSTGTGSVTPSTTAAGRASPEIITSPSEPASIEDYSLGYGDESEEESEEDDDEEEEEDGHVGHLPPRPSLQNQHSRSHTYLAPSTFAPPFYGRPPTPLPPSPSLTSLLRPNFSSQNSRPTTPDHSSDDGTPHTRGDVTGTQTPNSAAASTLTSSYRAAKPIARASPKVPTYEYYGFTLYLTSSLAFIVYLLWSFLPSPFLEQLGIYYYPDRWWALAIPAWTVMFILYIYVALASYNTGYLTLPMNSVECMVDEAANVAAVDARGNLLREHKPSWQTRTPKRVEKGKKGGKGKSGGGRSRQNSLTKSRAPAIPGQSLDWRTLWNEGTDAVMDIPIGGVCEILYGRYEDDDDVSGNAHDR